MARADFRAYEAMMHERGGRLGPDADYVIKDELSSTRYTEAEKQRVGGWPAPEQFRYFWEHPVARNAGWRKVDPEKVSSGLGWQITLERSAEHAPFAGSCTSIMSVYDPPGIKYIGQALQDDRNIAWAQFPVEFSSGKTVTLRFNFAFHEEQQVWYPARIDFPGAANPAPYFLF
jgi:hypothetical protein